MIPIQQMLNKVPEVTAYFWIIKVLCTTVGETVADYLNMALNLGLAGTSLVMGTLLIAVLVIQFKMMKYIPSIYWLTVVLISVVGTLITDNFTDNLGIPLEATMAVFAIFLVLTFGAWYWVEKTLSVHSIVTFRREIFYWLAILFTFALGTAVGDLIAEKLGTGYLTALLIFVGAIAAIAMAYYGIKLNAILTFWLIYILTRPLGASMGDYLSKSHENGGLALGATSTSAIFLAVILCLVVYLTFTKKNEIMTPVDG